MLNPVPRRIVEHPLASAVRITDSYIVAIAVIFIDNTLAIVSLGNQVTPTTDARRLERVLMEGLRTGDPVARLDAGSYILMLTGASEKSAWTVMDRLNRTFHKVYSHSRACISYRVSPLKPAGAC